jgi:hypothetical protein
MTRGYPDWRAPNVGVASLLSFVNTAGVADLIANPGVGFRITLVAIFYECDTAALTVIQADEVTPANVFVRTIGRMALPGAGSTPEYLYFALPLAENNKLRQTVAVVGAASRITTLYNIEPVT